MAPHEDGVATTKPGDTKITMGQPHLAIQDLTNLDVTKLTPLSPEVISRQVRIKTIPVWEAR